jgi:hypothetical protein
MDLGERVDQFKFPDPERAMSVIQIIEYETDRPDEIKALGEARMAQMPEAPPGFQITVTRNRDWPNRYLASAEFPLLGGGDRGQRAAGHRRVRQADGGALYKRSPVLQP